MGKENEQETKQLASFTDAQSAEVKQHFAALLDLLEKAKISDQGVDIGQIGQQIGEHLVAGVQNLQSLLSSASANELREALKDKAKGEKKKKKDKEGKKDKKKDKDEDESEEGEKKKKDKEGKKDKKKDKDEDESDEGEKKKKKDKKDKDKDEGLKVEQHPVALTEAQAGEAKKHFATLLEQLDKASQTGAGADVGVVGGQIGEHLLAGVGSLLAVLPSASANELREKLKEKAKAEKQKKDKKDKKDKKKKDEHDDDDEEEKKKEKKEKKEE